MKGGRRLPAVAPHPGEDGGLRVCIDILGLNRAASQECLWPSRVGRCKGPPHSYVRMPYGLPNAAAAHQRLMRAIVEAQESGVPQRWRRWRWPARSHPRLRSLLRPLGLGAREDRLPQPTESATPTPFRPQRHQVTSFKFHFQLGAPPRAALFPGRMGPSLRHVSLLFHVVSLLCWGCPMGCIIPKSLGPDPVMSAFPSSIWMNPLLRG